MPFSSNSPPPAKVASRNRVNSNREWIDGVRDFNNEGELRSLEDVKRLFPAVKDGASLSFLKIIRDSTKRCKKYFRRLVAVKYPVKRTRVETSIRLETPGMCL